MAEPLPKAPRAFDDFSSEFPKLRQAWDLLGEAAEDGPLDPKTARLAKLAVAIGAMREGAVHSSARKAIALGVTTAEMNQVVAAASSIIGMPSAVAVGLGCAIQLRNRDSANALSSFEGCESR